MVFEKLDRLLSGDKSAIPDFSIGALRVISTAVYDDTPWAEQGVSVNLGFSNTVLNGHRYRFTYRSASSKCGIRLTDP